MLTNDGYEKIFNKYYSKLRWVSYKIIYTDDSVSAVEDTKDIVLEAFITLHRKWSEVSDYKHAVRLLYIYVHHRSLNFLKHYNKHGTKELTDDFHEVPDSVYIESDLLSMIYATMVLLPPERKKVFTLLFIKGYSLAEVSAELNISIHTVKSQRKKAINTIRKVCHYE